MYVPVPSHLQEDEVFSFISSLQAHINEPAIVLDYGPVRYAYPFGALVLSEEIRRITKVRHELGFETKYCNYDEKNYCHSYLSHIGFFKHHGIAQGKKPGEATGSSAYVPFRDISFPVLKRLSERRGIEVNDVIDEEARRLAQIVLQLGDIVRGHPVAYCFREIIRNVFEHAETASCSVCAQKWYTGELEIAVVDRGRGIFSSLSERYKISSDSAALREAIKPGVSRVKDKPQTEDVWHNSGYGLYVLSELASRTGHFILCSGNTGLFCRGDEKLDKDYPFFGTAVKLKMTKPRGVNINDLITAIIKEGEGGTPQGAKRAASKSTKTI
jgi:hypothetical protein